MSTIEPRQALYAHLIADAAVVSAVGDRLYQRYAPAGARKPLIVIQPPISDVPQRDLDGVAYSRTRIQVTAIADTQVDVEKAARAVMTAVEGYSGMMADALQVIHTEVISDRQQEQDGIDDIRHHVDVLIKYKR